MYNFKQQNKGYMILEVLVTIGILAIGLLGIGAMQITALKSGVSAINRGEAAILMSAMSDRMRSNSQGVYAGNYHGLIDLGNPGFNAASPAARAQADFDQWNLEIRNTFVSQGVEAVALGQIACQGATPFTIRNCILRITWSDSRTENALKADTASTETQTYQHISSIVF